MSIYVKNTIVLPDLNTFSYDWKQPLISKIYTVDENDQCDKGDGEPALNLVWPGDDTICHGEDVSFAVKKANIAKAYPMVWLNGTCKQNDYGFVMRTSGSQILKGDAAVDMRSFQDFDGARSRELVIFNGKKYCGKHLEGNQTYSDLTVVKSTGCKIGYIQCNMNKRFCVKGDVCPINGLKLSSFVSDSKYTAVNFGSQKLLYTSKEQNAPPVTQISVELNKPCAIFTENSLIEDYKQKGVYQIYDQLNGCKTVNNVKFDDRFIPLDPISENLYEIYDANGIIKIQNKYAVTKKYIQDNLKKVKPVIFYKTANVLEQACNTPMSELNNINPQMKAGWSEFKNQWGSSQGWITGDFVWVFLAPFMIVFPWAACNQNENVMGTMVAICVVGAIFFFFKAQSSIGDSIVTFNDFSAKTGDQLKILSGCIKLVTPIDIPKFINDDLGEALSKMKSLKFFQQIAYAVLFFIPAIVPFYVLYIKFEEGQTEDPEPEADVEQNEIEMQDQTPANESQKKLNDGYPDELEIDEQAVVESHDFGADAPGQDNHYLEEMRRIEQQGSTIADRKNKRDAKVKSENLAAEDALHKEEEQMQFDGKEEVANDITGH